MIHPLDGRVALVTGASRGIGRAVAERLAVAGASVVLGGRDAALLEETVQSLPGAGTKVGVAVDLTSHDAPQQLVGAARELGGLDIVVNNAGTGHEARLADTSDADWEHVMAVNLTAPFRLLRAAEPLLRTSAHGRVVNVASGFALIGVSRWSAYSASKGGLISLSRSLAIEWAVDGVCVNVVAPGQTETDLTRELLERGDTRRAVERSIPLGRLGDPSDVAALVAFLASDDAAWITGQVYTVDGGWSVR